MTTKERMIAALAADAQLITLYDTLNTLQVYNLQAPQAPSLGDATKPEEFAYTVYRDMPVGDQPYLLNSPAIPTGLTYRKFAFETRATGSTGLALSPETQASAIDLRITQLLGAIAEPGGIGAVYPDPSPLSVWMPDDNCALVSRNFLIQTACDDPR
jgi:hypothetical protein